MFGYCLTFLLRLFSRCCCKRLLWAQRVREFSCLWRNGSALQIIIINLSSPVLCTIQYQQANNEEVAKDTFSCKRGLRSIVYHIYTWVKTGSQDVTLSRPPACTTNLRNSPCPSSFPLIPRIESWLHIWCWDSSFAKQKPKINDVDPSRMSFLQFFIKSFIAWLARYYHGPHSNYVLLDSFLLWMPDKM